MYLRVFCTSCHHVSLPLDDLFLQFAAGKHSYESFFKINIIFLLVISLYRYTDEKTEGTFSPQNLDCVQSYVISQISYYTRLCAHF
jgi:hypothetical protein